MLFPWVEPCGSRLSTAHRPQLAMWRCCSPPPKGLQALCVLMIGFNGDNAAVHQACLTKDFFGGTSSLFWISSGWILNTMRTFRGWMAGPVQTMDWTSRQWAPFVKPPSSLPWHNLPRASWSYSLTTHNNVASIRGSQPLGCGPVPVRGGLRFWTAGAVCTATIDTRATESNGETRVQPRWSCCILKIKLTKIQILEILRNIEKKNTT